MNEIRRRDGRPIWLQEGGAAQALRRVDIGSTATSGYDEAWLQALLNTQPTVFPIEQIETGFGDPYSPVPRTVADVRRQA